MEDTIIILPVSREDFLIEVITKLELLDCDQTRVSILCIVDGDDRLYIKTRNLIMDTKFNNKVTVMLNSKDKMKQFDIAARRKKIAEIHNFAKTLIGNSQYVLLVEDDTLLPPHALNRLREDIEVEPGIAYVEGVEVGRWGIPYVGAWKFDNIYNPTQTTSLDYEDKYLTSIDAGGFYCALMKTKIYKEFNFKLYEGLGPDVSMGLMLRQQGYSLYIDWEVPCTHLNIVNGKKETLVPSPEAKVVTMKRDDAKKWHVIY